MLVLEARPLPTTQSAVLTWTKGTVFLAASLAFVLFGAGILVFLLPALPFLLIAVVVWALFRGRDRATVRNGAHTTTG